MKTHKRIAAVLLSLIMVLATVVWPGKNAEIYATSPGDSDFDVNSEWILSDDITSEHTALESVNNGGAFKTGRSFIGEIGVTATFEKTDGRPNGVSYLSENAGNQSAYGMTPDMLYGNPDPASIPALGINTQPGSSINGYASYNKMNLNGVPKEEGILTFTFDKPVTDPVLDLSGLGGYTEAFRIYRYYYQDGSSEGPFIVARGSFNSTDLELLTPGVSMEIGAGNSNFIIDNNTIKVKDRNTHTRAVLTFDYNDRYVYDDNGNLVAYLRGPNLEPAGSGSVLLKGTFQKVSFRLYHVATPYSAFPTNTYGTSGIYSWRSSWGPEYGDGVNGLNLLKSEKFNMAGNIAQGQQNWDLFRASLRLPKPSAVSGKAWIDINRDGINNDAAKPPKKGVKASLLNEDGSPAVDFNGNPVAPIEVDENGAYRFDNLAAGNYKVKFEDPYDAGFTSKHAAGSTDATNSDVNPDGNSKGITDTIVLGVNEEKPNIDAGIIPLPSKISGRAWLDTNKDGIQNAGETEIAAGTKVRLEDSDGNAVKDFDGNDVGEVTLSDNGTYEFTNLAPGDYRVVFTAPDGKEFTQQGKGTDSKIDSDANRETGKTGVITLESGDEKTNYDAGLIPIYYQVTHEFKSGTEGKVLPDEVKALLPGNQTGKVNGDTVEPTQPSAKSVTTDEGIWTFQGYDETSKTINAADQKFTGTWVLTPKEYIVTHEFVSGTDGYELPDEVRALLPENQSGKQNGDQVSPTMPGETSVEITEGTWTFKGYDRNSDTIQASDQKFIGTWEFTPKEEPTTYIVTHEFESATPGRELPQAVKDLLPGNQTDKENGAKVNPTQPTDKATGEVREKVEVEDGVWTFIGYDETEKTIDNADQKFIGKWEFTPKTYKASHEFVSGTEGKELPQEVKDLLPGNKNGLANGASVSPDTPDSPIITDEGEWTFKGYDYSSQTIAKADVEFVGTWEFTPKFYGVTYEFKSGTDGKEELPPEVNALLPEPETGRKNGEEVTPAQPVEKTVTTKEGTWTFVEYDREKATIDKKYEHFVGYWTFEKAEAASISGKIWFDTNENGIQDDEKDEQEPKFPSGVTATLTDKDGVPVTEDIDGNSINPIEIGNDGKYSFTNLPAGDYKVVFNATNGEKFTLPKATKETSKDSDVFPDGCSTGVITLEPGDKEVNIDAGFLPKKYKVTYEFQSGTDGKKLPDEIKALLPVEQSGKKNGEEVKPTAPEKTYLTTDDGIWKFQRYDEDSKKIAQADAKFVGTWKFTSKSEIGNVYVKYVAEDGTVLEEESIVKKDAPDGEAYQTEKKTFKGYEFVKMADGSAEASGKVVGGEDLHVTYVYKPAAPNPKPETGNVYVKYITEDGTVLEEESQVITNGKAGTDYKTEKKAFEGYEFVKMADGSAEANGKVVGGKDLHVTYVYKPAAPNPKPETGNVYVKYITEDGKVLEESIVKKDAPDGEAYKTEKKTFKGYEFVKMADDSAAISGTVAGGEDLHVTYVYKANKTAGSSNNGPGKSEPTGNPSQAEPGQGNSPKTGDDFSYLFYFCTILFLAAGALRAVIGAKSKDKK